MTAGLSAQNECISMGGWRDGEHRPSVAGVVLRGRNDRVTLTAGEARVLAREIEGWCPELTKQLEEAANGVDHFTRFDGPLGACDEVEAQPGNYDMAKRLIASVAKAEG